MVKRRIVMVRMMVMSVSQLSVHLGRHYSIDTKKSKTHVLFVDATIANGVALDVLLVPGGNDMSYLFST